MSEFDCLCGWSGESVEAGECPKCGRYVTSNSVLKAEAKAIAAEAKAQDKADAAEAKAEEKSPWNK